MQAVVRDARIPKRDANVVLSLIQQRVPLLHILTQTILKAGGALSLLMGALARVVVVQVLVRLRALGYRQEVEGVRVRTPRQILG